MNRPTTAVNPWFQCIIFVISLVLLGIAAQGPMYRFTVRDQLPELHKYGEKISVPSQQIETAVHIHYISEANIAKGEFTFTGFVLFEFDETEVSRTDISKFIVDGGEILERLEPAISQHNHKTVARYFIRARCKNNLNFTAYPLDDHMLNIVISNPFIDASRIAFVMKPTNFTCSPDIHIPNVRIHHTEAHAGYTYYQATAHPRMICNIACDRIDIRHFVNLFLPLMLIFFMSLFAFSMDHREQYASVISLAAAGTPALLAYRFVIEAASPDVDYFMLSDYLFFLFLTLSFAIFFAALVAATSSVRIKNMIIMSLYGITVLACSALFYTIL